jgi:hypothetical protein
MKDVIEEQKKLMGDLDLDKLDDIRDQMEDLKY